jgi:hypothetical protein
MQRLNRLSIPLISWVLFHITFLVILLDREDVNPVVLNRYSVSYAALLALIAAVGLIGVVILWRFRQMQPSHWLITLRTSRLVTLAIIALGIWIMFAIWMTPFQMFVTPVQKQLLRSYGTLAVLGFTYAALFWRGRDVCDSWRTWAVVAGVIGAIGLILSVHYLDRYPQLNRIDELHNWVVQWTYANTGLLGDTLYRQMIPIPQPIYDSPHYIFGWLLRYIGDTFWQARFARLLMAVLALPFIYLCGKRMYGKRAGLFAVIVALFLLPPTAYVRPDVFVGVMLSAALYVYLRAQTTRRPWMHFLTGLCIALGGEGHPLAYRFGIAVTLIYVVRWAYEMRQTRRFFIDGRLFALGLGGTTGMLIYLSIHILPNLTQGLHFAKNYSPLGDNITDRWEAAKYLLTLQFEVWVETSPLELVFVALGLALAIYELNQGDRLLLTLLLVSEGLMLATYSYYRPFYQVHFLPIFALLGGRLLANLTNWRDSRSPAGWRSSLVLASMVFITALGILNQNAVSASDDPERAEFTAIARQIKTDLPPNLIVVGNENYFIEMRSLNYYGIQTVTTDRWFLVDYEGYKLWEVTKPDVFIMTDEMDEAKYTDVASIYAYIRDNKFQLARCYTHTGLINARVYMREMPPGWTVDYTCRRYGIDTAYGK